MFFTAFRKENCNISQNGANFNIFFLLKARFWLLSKKSMNLQEKFSLKEMNISQTLFGTNDLHSPKWIYFKNKTFRLQVKVNCLDFLEKCHWVPFKKSLTFVFTATTVQFQNSTTRLAEVNLNLWVKLKRCVTVGGESPRVCSRVEVESGTVTENLAHSFSLKPALWEN